MSTSAPSGPWKSKGMFIASYQYFKSKDVCKILTFGRMAENSEGTNDF